MDISALKYFQTAAELQHMNRAAQKLNITQPSLSASIRRLESEIGFPLFDRTGRGIVLNDYGQIFLRAVNEIDTVMEDCLAEMRELREHSVSLIRLACSNSPVNSRLIDRLLENGANLQVSVIPKDWEQELLSKNCDLVITMGVLHHPHIRQAVLCRQKLVFVVALSHPLAQASVLSLSDLKRYAFCSTDTPYSLANVVMEQHPELNFHPRLAFLGRNSGDMIKAIGSGRYIGLMVQRNLPASENLRILPVEDFRLSLPIHLYWREKDENLAALDSLRREIIDFYTGLPEG